MATSMNKHEQLLRSAIEAGQLDRAETALQAYIAWLESGSRTVDEVQSARDLLAWGIRAVKAQSAQAAEELARLTKVAGGYVPGRRMHTWRLEG
jgi:hypothetical protein